MEISKFHVKISAIVLLAVVAGCQLGTCPPATLCDEPSWAAEGNEDAYCQTSDPAASLALYEHPDLVAPGSGSDLPPVAIGAEMTLDRLEQLALQNNPSLGEARARVDAIRGKWLQAGLPPNTVLGYSGQQLASNGLAEQQGLSIGQEFVRGGKLQLNRAIAEREIEVAEQQWFAQEQRVLTDVRIGFYNVLVAQRRLEITERLVEIADQAVLAAERLLAGQEVSRVDVMRARVEQKTEHLRHENAKNDYKAAWEQLVAVLGVEQMPAQPLHGNLEDIASAVGRQEALDRLLTQSPELSAALLEVERSRWSVDRALVEPVPNIDVQAVVQQDNGTGAGNANLQVTMPIPWLDRNQGAIRRAQSELIAAEHAVERVERGLRRRLAAIYRNYVNARQRVQQYTKDDGILANAQEALELIRQAYEAGEVPYLDLITAQRIYSQNNLAYVESLGEFWSAAMEIDGLLLKDSLASR